MGSRYWKDPYRSSPGWHLLPGMKGTFTSTPAFLAALFYCSGSAQHDQICDAHVTRGLNAFQHAQHFLQTFGFVSSPSLSGSKTNTGTVGTSAVIRCSEGTGTIPCSSDQLCWQSVRCSGCSAPGCRFRHRSVCRYRPDRILPDEIFLRYIGAEVATLRSHITMGQLEPGTAKASSNAAGSWRNFRDLPVFRIHLHRHISIGHDGVGDERRICASKGFSSSGILTGSHWDWHLPGSSSLPNHNQSSRWK